MVVAPRMELELFYSLKSRLANGLYGEIVRHLDYSVHSATLQSQSCPTAVIVMMTIQRLHFCRLYCETDRLHVSYARIESRALILSKSHRGLWSGIS
jgi:hypothetical protein